MHPPNASNLSLILNRLDEIAEKQHQIEQGQNLILGHLGKKQISAEWLSIRDAAQLAGLKLWGVRSMLRRNSKRPDGIAVTRRRGFVRRRDFECLLEAKAKQFGDGQGQVARHAVNQIMNGEI